MAAGAPPGIHGLQPNLALLYDSHVPNGLMGPGWTLTGLSAISRCNPTFAQDGTPAPITLTTADGLCLDGNRLRTAGAGVYQTEIANFSQVTASGTAGSGPSYFTVQGKDGLTYEYGNTTDSKMLPAGSSTPYTWALDKVTDRSGNQMTVSYTASSSGLYAPLSIKFTAPSGSTSFPYAINFAYSSKAANDMLTTFVAGAQMQQTQQLSTITVTSSGNTVRVYNLSYTTSSVTQRATLTSIQECGGPSGTDCLSATTVGYQSGTLGVASPATATGIGANIGTVYSIDVDGDGRQDLLFGTVSGSTYQWWVQRATATGYGSSISTGASTPTTGTMQNDILVNDFAAIGSNQILAPVSGTWYAYAWNGSGFTATSTGVAVVPSVYYASADVDGDGRPDLVYADPVAGVISVRLNTSASGVISFASPVVTSTPIGGVVGLMGDNQVSSSAVQHLDFDGDARGDFLIVTHSGSSSYVTELLSSRERDRSFSGTALQGVQRPFLQRIGMMTPAPTSSLAPTSMYLNAMEQQANC